MNEHEKFEDIEKELRNKVPWVTFAWGVSIIITVIGGLSFWVNSAASTGQAALEKANIVDTRTGAQFDEILRSLDRIEKGRTAVK